MNKCSNKKLVADTRKYPSIQKRNVGMMVQTGSAWLKQITNEVQSDVVALANNVLATYKENIKNKVVNTINEKYVKDGYTLPMHIAAPIRKVFSNKIKEMVRDTEITVYDIRKSGKNYSVVYTDGSKKYGDINRVMQMEISEIGEVVSDRSRRRYDEDELASLYKEVEDIKREVRNNTGKSVWKQGKLQFDKTSTNADVHESKSDTKSILRQVLGNGFNDSQTYAKNVDEVVVGKLASVPRSNRYDMYMGHVANVMNKVYSPDVVEVPGMVTSNSGKPGTLLHGMYDKVNKMVVLGSTPTTEEIDRMVSKMVKNDKRLTGKEQELISEVLDATARHGGRKALAHEMVHAGTTEFIDRVEKDKYASKRDKELLGRLKELYVEALDKREEIAAMASVKDTQGHYWTESLHEFVAEALSNPTLVHALSKVKSKVNGRMSTMLDRLMSIVKKMLGVRDGVKNSIYEMVLDSVTAIAEDYSKKKEIESKALMVDTDGVKAMMVSNEKDRKLRTEYTKEMKQVLKGMTGAIKMDKNVGLGLMSAISLSTGAGKARGVTSIEGDIGYYAVLDSEVEKNIDKSVMLKTGLKYLASKYMEQGYSKSDAIMLANKQVHHIDKMADVLAKLEKIDIDGIAVHELVHVATTGYMANNKDSILTKKMVKMYKKMVELDDAGKLFSKKGSVNNGYWRRDVDEFAAEMMRSEDLIEAAMGIDEDGNTVKFGNESIWHRVAQVMVDMVNSIVGNEDTMYESVAATITKMVLDRGSNKGINGMVYNDVLGATEKDKKSKKKDVEYTAQSGVLHSKKDMMQMADLIAMDDTVSDADKKELMDTLGMMMESNGKYIPAELELYVANEGDMDTSATFQPDSDKPGIYFNEGRMVSTEDVVGSKLEKFVHDITHTALFYAIESKVPAALELVKQLTEIHEQVADKLTWDMLVGKNVSAEKMQSAKDMVKYIQNGPHAIHEFAAYALTNKRFKDAISKLQDEKKKTPKTIIEQIVSIVKGIVDAFMGRWEKRKKGSDLLDITQKLLNDLRKINNEAEVEIRRNSAMQKIGEIWNGANEKTVKLIEKLTEMVAGDEKLGVKENIGKMNVVEKMWFLMKNFGKLMGNKSYRIVYADMLDSINIPGLGINDSLQTGLRLLSKNDKLRDTLENLGLRSTKIDEDMFNIETSFSGTVNKMLGNASIGDQEKYTQVMIETDMQVLVHEGKMSVEDVLDEDKRKEKALELEDEISKWDNGEYYIGRAEDTARYMVTGKGGVMTMMNAHNIYTLDGTGERPVKINRRKVGKIDQLISLYAMDKVSKGNKGLVGKLDSKVVSELLAIHRGQIHKTYKSTFSGRYDKNIQKGYIADIFDKHVDVKFGRLEHEKVMNSQGYFKIDEVVDRDIGVQDVEEVNNGKSKLYIYVNQFGGISEFQKQAIRTVNSQRKGTTLANMYQNEDELKGKKNLVYSEYRKREKAAVKKMVSNNKKMFKKLSKSRKNRLTDGMIPIVNEKGKAITYRAIMSKRLKKKVFKQDKRMGVVMGQMGARAYNKAVSGDINKEAIDIMMQDVRDNYDVQSKKGKDLHKYEMFGPNVDNEEIKDIWYMIPEMDREYLIDKLAEVADEKGMEYDADDVVIPIRKDLLFTYLGRRNYSLASKTFSGTNGMGMPARTANMLARVVSVADELWKMVVKREKATIIIKTPIVWTMNILGNFVQGVRMGHSPIKILGYMRKGIVAFMQTYRMLKEIVKLGIQVDARRAKGLSTNTSVSKKERVLSSLKRHSAFDLVTAGMASSIISEELGADDMKLDSGLERRLARIREILPAWVVKGIDILFLNENTSVYRTFLLITQMGDFIHRYSVYHAMIEKEKEMFVKKNGKQMSMKGVKGLEENARNIVKEMAVNYNKEVPQMLKFMEERGVVQFLRWKFGIQPTLTREMATKPLNMLVSTLTKYNLVDIDNTANHSMTEIPFNIVEAITTGRLDALVNTYGPLAVMEKAFQMSGAAAFTETFSDFSNEWNKSTR